MNVKNWWKRVAIGGAAALTVAAGLSIASLPALAQDDSARPDGPRAGFMQRGGMGHHGGFHGGDRGAYLADALGISVEQLEEAQQSAMNAALADAVSEGRITQEQADLMQARAALRSYLDRDAILATVLGISVEEVEAAKEDGTLRDLVGELDRATLREEMAAAQEAAIAQAVADGVITQAQADQLSEAGKGFGPRGSRFEGRDFFPNRDGAFGPDRNATPAGEGL